MRKELLPKVDKNIMDKGKPGTPSDTGSEITQKQVSEIAAGNQIQLSSL